MANANASSRPLRNGPAISCGKNARPLIAAALCAGSLREHVRPEQLLRRVVAEERGEEHRDGRQLAHARRDVRGDAVRLQTRRERVRQRPGEPDDHQREEDPDRQDLRGVLERLIHAAARTSMLRGQAVHHAGPVRRGECAHRRCPIRGGWRASSAYEKLTGEHREQKEAERRDEHPARRERPRAVAVGQDTRDRAGDEEADRQRQHPDPGPQRRRGEADAVLGQPDPLQPDDQHEHQAAARDRGEEAREHAEGERADLEQLQLEHRRLRTQLDDDEQREQERRPPRARRSTVGTVQPIGCGRRTAGFRT